MSKPLLLLLLCVAAGLHQNWSHIDRWLHPPTPRPPGTDKVALYATSWCGYCAKTRAFFAENHIAYQEWNVEEAGEGQRVYRKLGGGGVPIIVINGTTVIRGYDPDSINDALGRAP